MKKLLLIMLLAIPFTAHAQKSYVHIYVTEALKLSESHHSGSTMYLTGDIPSGLKDYYYYFNDDMTIGKLMTLLGREGFVLEKAFEMGNGEGEIVIMSRGSSPSQSKIQTIETEEGEPHEVARYNLQCLPAKPTEKGIQIIVYSNYTTKAVIVE